MRRRLTSALGALALGWLAGPALAADPVDNAASAPTLPAMPVQSAAPPALAPVGAAPGDPGGGWGHVIGGAGVYFLKPFVERDRAWVKLVSVPGQNGDFQNVTATDFDYNFEAAPRFWLGWVSDSGWGARARYFHFDADGFAPPGTLSSGENFNGAPLDPHSFALNAASPLGQSAVNEATANLLNNNLGTDVLTVDSRLQMDVWDVEAIDQVTGGAWQWTFAGGVRHADFAEFYDATRRNTTDVAGTDVRMLRSSNRFTGTGPTLAVDGRRTLGDTALALYGTVRGAGLFGTRRLIATASSTGPIFHMNGDGTLELFSGSLGTSALEKNDFVPVAEGEFGVEWSRDLGGYRPFVQVGLVGQGWLNALSNDNPNSGIPPTPVNANGVFGLFGVNIAGGVSF